MEHAWTFKNLLEVSFCSGQISCLFCVIGFTECTFSFNEPQWFDLHLGHREKFGWQGKVKLRIQKYHDNYRKKVGGQGRKQPKGMERGNSKQSPGSWNITFSEVFCFSNVEDHLCK